MSAIDDEAATRGTQAPEYLAQWVSRQRWYASKGHVPELRSIGSWTLSTAEPGVRIRTYLILDVESERAELYQVPVTERESPLDGGESALITMTDDAEGRRYFYDAPHDPAYTSALLQVILSSATVSDDDGRGVRMHGEAFASERNGAETVTDITVRTMKSSRVLSGEQSNTSIVFDLLDRDLAPTHPLICKLFRALHHGVNPDVEVQLALAGAGSRYVPWPVGSVVGEWDDPGLPGDRATGHLAFAQEFLPGVEDAWRVALRAAECGDDVTARMYDLGQATADVHASLARVMPTTAATEQVISRIVDGMRERYRMAEHEVPVLGQYRSAVEDIFAAAQAALWPMLQRIHGDYHLGQVLNAPGRGWVLIDFEGEPLRPMDERDQPDVPLRDVAGMLRSFSYVAGALAMEQGELPDNENQTASDAVAWAFSCRDAFLEGYAVRAGHDPRDNRVLLDSFELDKAIYEAVYETRNRPEWVPIPLMAIRRLIASTTTAPATDAVS